MNEEQYRSVCEACDRLLLAPDSMIVHAACYTKRGLKSGNIRRARGFGAKK